MAIMVSLLHDTEMCWKGHEFRLERACSPRMDVFGESVLTEVHCQEGWKGQENVC
jgi:hypothetical protein